jgi:hypothetical protein
MALTVIADLRCAALALAARVALAKDDTPKALALAEEAVSIERSRPDVELMTGLAGLALAEVHLRKGEREAAKLALAPVVEKLANVSRTLTSDEARTAFWQRPLPNAEIRVLANTLGLDVR